MVHFEIGTEHKNSCLDNSDNLVSDTIAYDSKIEAYADYAQHTLSTHQIDAVVQVVASMGCLVFDDPNEQLVYFFVVLPFWQWYQNML